MRVASYRLVALTFDTAIRRGQDRVMVRRKDGEGEGINRPLAQLAQLGKQMRKAPVKSWPARSNPARSKSVSSSPASSSPESSRGTQSVKGQRPAKPAKAGPASGAAPVTPEEPKASLKSDEALATYTRDDQVAFHQAFAGVDSLESKHHKRQSPDRNALANAVRARAEAAEEDARRRLDALVGGGVHFDLIRHGDGGIEGRRRGAPDRTCRMLAMGELAPSATLDLHGFLQAEVESAVRTFVRGSHKAGRQTLRIVHGKGNHSEGGKGVLRGAVVKALTGGGAAPVVEAFASAPERFGGDGALLIRLRRR